MIFVSRPNKRPLKGTYARRLFSRCALGSAQAGRMDTRTELLPRQTSSARELPPVSQPGIWAGATEKEDGNQSRIRRVQAASESSPPRLGAFWALNRGSKVKKAEGDDEHDGRLLLFLRAVRDRDQSGPFRRTEVFAPPVDRQEGASPVRLPLVADVREFTVQGGNVLGRVCSEVEEARPSRDDLASRECADCGNGEAQEETLTLRRLGRGIRSFVSAAEGSRTAYKM